MPIYEYACEKCGHQFEALQRMSETASPSCEKCGAKRARRKFSTFAMHGGGAKSSSGESGGGHGSNCGGCQRGSCAGCGH